MQPPPIDAPFADKMAYNRVQHTSKGVNVTHQIGTQIIVFGLPLQRCGQRKVASAAPTPPTGAITGARPATMAA